MKKRIVFLMCLCALTPSMATEPTSTCEDHGGTLIKAHVATDPGCSADTCNGHEFCLSDKNMNWWSAFTWCESQGRRLADFTTMCGNVSQSPSNTEGDCPNLQGKGDAWMWSSLAYSFNTALVVLPSGAVQYGYRSVTLRALCE